VVRVGCYTTTADLLKQENIIIDNSAGLAKIAKIANILLIIFTTFTDECIGFRYNELLFKDTF